MNKESEEKTSHLKIQQIVFYLSRKMLRNGVLTDSEEESGFCQNSYMKIFSYIGKPKPPFYDNSLMAFRGNFISSFEQDPKRM